MSWPQPRWAPPFATTGLKSTPNLPLIDLRHLSQPELLSLSFSGSRKQTFLRLRLAPRNNNASSSSNSTPAVPFQ
ncbi:hypothetical protein OIU79_000710, partial [Salix purpurea]